MVFLISLIFAIIFRPSCSLGPIETLISSPMPYALSPTYLEFLSKQERKIYVALKDYEEQLEERLRRVKKYTKDYEDSSISGVKYLGPGASNEEKDEIIASNPVLSYRMLSRHANEFYAIGEHINQNAEEISSNIVLEAKGPYDFPSLKDIETATTGLLRSQFTYNLKSHDIAEGRIPGSNGSIARLTTEQCHQIATFAKMNKYYTLALEWFNTTKTRLQMEDNSKSFYSFDEADIIRNLHATVTEHNKHYQELYDEGHEYIFTKRVRSFDATPPTLQSQIVEQYAGLNLSESDPDYHQAVHATHIALCNGANFQSQKHKSKLVCWEDHKRNPYWIIKPLKIELVNQSPQIIQIHDFMTEKWMKYLKKAAYSALEKAPEGPNATPRTAAYSWFPDTDLLPHVQLSRRLEFFTGLNVVGEKAAESLQVAAYAFGGHVELHYDSKGPNDPVPDPKGERVITFLVYMNNVEFGGYTSFPKLGFAVKPSKGSALMWYTNRRNGGVDLETLHGACPLISGHKWIATKWIHSNENMLTRPCSLSDKE